MSQNEPIRVAQIMGKLWAGGVEMVLFNYYRAIDKTKIQFDFYYDADSTVEPPKDLIDMGARFIKIPPYQKLPSYLSTLRKHFKENNYRIVHSHINTLSVFPLFVAWACNIPVRIAHNHSVPGGNEFKRNALKYFLRLFSKVFSTDYFACTEMAGRWLFGDKTFDEGKVFVVNNAIDFDRFRPSQEIINTKKKELGLKNRFVIGHIGRFTYAKNHDLLLKIFKILASRREDAVLLLVGDGELHERIVSLIKEYDIENRVILAGQVSNPELYYRLADVIVLPSRFEGLPLTSIESQVAGIPVVVSEAIPKEAKISNGLFYCSVNDSIETWIDKIENAINCEVILNEHSDDFNILKRANLLSDWYISHYIM